MSPAQLIGRLLGLAGAIGTLASSLGLRYRALRGQQLPVGSRSSALCVLFMHRDLPFHGGVPRCLLYLARATDSHRIDFRLACFKEPSPGMTQAFSELGIAPDCLGDKGYWKPTRKLAAIVAGKNIDVLVVTSFKAYLCAKAATLGKNVRVIFWLHAVRGAVEGPIRRKLLAVLSRHDPMLFVSNAVRRAQLPPSHQGSAEVIYNGVEDMHSNPQYEPYPMEMRRDFGISDAKLVLAFTAEYVDWKDHATLIEAMHELSRRGFEAQLLLIGAGELMQATAALAQRGPAANHIHFLGARSDARRLLGLVDIYVHPSRNEGFGLAVVEAMLAGCPVVTARDGAMIEYISHGKTGLLFCPGDAIDLADSIMKLAADRVRAAEMGRAARAYCLQTFDIDRFADAVGDFITQSCPPEHTHQDDCAIDAPPTVSIGARS